MRRDGILLTAVAGSKAPESSWCGFGRRIFIEDGKQPLEVLRTIHSFDPCIACAVHVVDLKTF